MIELLPNPYPIEIIGSGDTPTEDRFAKGNEETLDRIRTNLRALLEDPNRRDEWSKFETELERLSSRTAKEVADKIGVVSRQYRPDDDSYGLGLISAKRAIENARINDPDFTVGKIGFIAFGSSTSNNAYPGGDAFVHQHLELGPTEGVSLSNACCSGVKAMVYAYRAMRLDPSIEAALVVTGDVPGSTGTADEDEDATLWGDGGASFVLKTNRKGQPGTGIFVPYGRLDAGPYEDKGNKYDMTLSEGQGAARCHRGLRLNGSMCGHGHDIYEIVRREIPKHDLAWILANGYVIDCEGDDRLLPHNGSLKMITRHGRALGFSEESIFHRIPDRANQSAVSALSTYAHFSEQGKIRPGMRLWFDVFGSNLEWWLVPYQVPYT